MSALIEQLVSDGRIANDDYAEVRRRAQKVLLQHGFPDLKTEAWKYTSLGVLEKRQFEAAPASSAALPELPFDACVLHFDNGLLSTDGLDLPAGVRLEAIEPGELADVDHGDRAGAFGWLNLARFDQAWRLRIEGEQERPLVLVTSTSNDFRADVHPRLRIELASQAKATLVEVHQALGEGLVNLVQDIHLAPGARLGHLLHRSNAESAWVQRTRVDVDADADYRFHALDNGGRLVRHDLNVSLRQSGANGEIDGVVLLDSKQHVDYHTAFDHQVGHTNSRESFRMLADGTGVGVFNGRIHIARGADDSHSDLNTANLLLSDSARINTKPELEIYAEEVTASHGATIGQLEDTALFYLRSRGLSSDQAMAMLKVGFAAAPLNTIENEALRDWLLSELNEAL